MQYVDSNRDLIRFERNFYNRARIIEKPKNFCFLKYISFRKPCLQLPRIREMCQNLDLLVEKLRCNSLNAIFRNNVYRTRFAEEVPERVFLKYFVFNSFHIRKIGTF